MKALVTLFLLLLAPELQATDPQPAADMPCASPRVIIGARTQDRPIPVMSGDATNGFRPACSVRWNVLSPDNAPLTVASCYRDNLLQITNQTVCGAGTGRLWIPARWVVTADAPVTATKLPAAACQRLETGVYAASRGLDPTCVPKK